MTWQELLLRTVLVGCGATLVMDIWLWICRRLGWPGLNFALLGRWVGHFSRGQLVHTAIAQAAPIRYEQALGYLLHYLIGVAFATFLIALFGPAWLESPNLGMALATGLGTVLFPWFLMQPAMGLGIAAAHTPSPWQNRMRSLCNHGVFGFGLFVTARILNWIP